MQTVAPTVKLPNKKAPFGAFLISAGNPGNSLSPTGQHRERVKIVACEFTSQVQQVQLEQQPFSWLASWQLSLGPPSLSQAS